MKGATTPMPHMGTLVVAAATTMVAMPTRMERGSSGTLCAVPSLTRSR